MTYEYEDRETGKVYEMDFPMGEAPDKVAFEGLTLHRKFNYGIGRVGGAGGSPPKGS